ncbi:MAG: glycosyltransferase family 4 protein [Butyrivibrio sp.]|nr:glycosyltransferase family 4 protein [Butyrivibrio sp.]
MRCFIITGMKCRLGGGGGGVAYRLLSANNKYSFLENAYFIFSDVIVESPSGYRTLPPWEDPCPDPIAGFKALNDRFEFREDDVFVVHDLECFYCLKVCSDKVKNTIMVYHGQGSPYYEYVASGNPADDGVRLNYAKMAYFALSQSSYFAFPSKGAVSAFIDTAPELNEYTDNKAFEILYNGCSPSDISDSCAYDAAIDEMTDENTKVFITVATLNEAKAVERLPLFFAHYMKHENNFLWIVIGDGAKRDELENNLKGIEGHVLWIKDKVDNRDVLHLMQRADYYIIAQRFSIFDFSTIEAMSMNCVPVLSPVGGNFEVITDNNGYLLETLPGAEEFAKWEKTIDLQSLKVKNQEIAKAQFSEKAMLQRYCDLIGKLTG